MFGLSGIKPDTTGLDTLPIEVGGCNTSDYLSFQTSTNNVYLLNTMACILLSRLDGAASFDTKPDPTQHENLTQPQIQPDLTRCIFLVGMGQWAKKI